MSGWIKIHRKIRDHWVWKDEQKLKWWLDILCEVNYEAKKVLVKGQLIECGRGQSVQSLETWAKDWRTTKKTVSSFFQLLARDNMLIVENLKVTTRITVCNYDSYQDSVNAEDTERKHNGNAADTESKHTLPPTKEVQEFKEQKQEEEGDGSPPPKEDSGFSQMLSQNAGFNPAQNFGTLSPAEMLLSSDQQTCLDHYFSASYFNDTRNELQKTYGMDSDLLRGWAEVFVSERIKAGEPKKVLKDWASHFDRWLNKKRDFLDCDPKAIAAQGWQRPTAGQADGNSAVPQSKLGKNLSALERALEKNKRLHESRDNQTG